ncbi:MAG: NADH-quinone oxidoreductase subunit N [Candidatus Eisenbacteria bacterium]
MIETLAIPILVAILWLVVFLFDLAAGPKGGRGAGWITFVGLLGIFGVSWMLQPGGSVARGAFVLDDFALYMQRIMLGATALGVLASIDHTERTMPRRKAEYFQLFLFSLLGMLFLAGAKELILLIVAFELMGTPLYILAAMHKTDKHGIEGSLKLYLTGAVSAAVTLYGLSFIFGATGTTMLPQIAHAHASPFLILGLLLALAGMGFKVGAAPFHMWIPDTYQGAPTPFVAFLSVAPKVAGFAALTRLFVEGLGPLRETWWPVLFAVCAATMLIGNVFALNQANVKRLLGYSGIAHVGLLLLALGIGTQRGLGVMLFYLATYVFTNMGAFFVAEVVGRSGSDEIDAYRGLARRKPWLGLAMLLFLLSLGGIPFVAGFWAKIFLFWAAWEAGVRWLVLLGAVLAVVALYYYLRVARSIYIEKPAENGPSVEIPWTTGAAIVIAMVGVVAIGIRPSILLEPAIRAARSVIGG